MKEPNTGITTVGNESIGSRLLDLITTTETIRTIQIMLLSFCLTGCAGIFSVLDATGPSPHWNEKSLGNLDLSVKDSKCEVVFKWNDYQPSLVLVLSDTNSTTMESQGKPNSPIVVQVDAFDKSSGTLVLSRRITKEHMAYQRWSEHGKLMPETSVLMDVQERYGDFQEGHSYKFVLTVLQEAKDLGPAKVFIQWFVGGDSM